MLPGADCGARIRNGAHGLLHDGKGQVMSDKSKPLAYRINHYDFNDICIVWAHTRGAARWAVVDALTDTWEYSPRTALLGLHCIRAPEYDDRLRDHKVGRAYGIDYVGGQPHEL